jgi:hypothetical protein
VLQAAFVVQIQPPNPDFESCVILAQAVPDGKARAAQAELLRKIKLLCGQQRMPIAELVTDRDSGYNGLHEI